MTENNVKNEKLVATPETWDKVAEAYSIELEDGDYQLASNIEDILISHGLKPGDSLIEMGCGSGHLSLCLAQKGYKVTLVDFSSVALEKARLTFEKYGVEGEFILGDLFNLDEKLPVYDYAWNSGVMEHFGDDEIAALMKNIGKHAKKGVLYLVPNSNSIAYLLMRARLMADDEWIYGEEYLRRDYADILTRLGYKKVEKSFVTTAAVSAYQMWKADKEQGNISELYKRLSEENMLPEQEGYLVSYYASDREDAIEEKKYSGSTVQDTRIFDLVAKKIGYNEQKNLIEILNLKNRQLQEANQQLQETNQQLATDDRLIRQEIVQYESRILNAKTTCYKINTSTSYRIVCALGRFVNQFLKGNKQEKKEFLSICKNCITRKKSEFTRNDGYNMILNVCNVLDTPVNLPQQPVAEEEKEVSKEEPNGSVVLPSNISSITKKCLEQVYNKPDIIIFSVINYDFRYQRPQHFASRFAENGHRVFYINANFTNKESVKNVTDNLYVVDWVNDTCNAIYYLSDWKLQEQWFKSKANELIYQYAIKDAIIILDYPNWVYGAEYLRHSFGFRVVVDYMDDFTGFLGTTTNVLKDNCIHMLKTSDLVIASSQFLSDIAKNYASQLSIVRNGTEVEHFYQALEMETHKKRPVIGYYGAVSHWFDWEKVCYVAKNMPDCDVVIIGEITEHRDELEKYSNIKLLGEKNYKELPEHLAYFDVCLIPFDTSTDLIKATNPVKFYEYLSAGKRIVATEIPELEPYRDQYVYMSNDNETFLGYVKLCLRAEDTLKSREECVDFAKENDWQKRYETFADVCLNSTPKVSIIVLTYNNLELNKACIDSILSKTAYPNYELIILDNMSTDGTVEYLQELDKANDPRIKIIINDRNSGFAGGNNKAIKEATGKYIMLLNNDTVVTRGWLTNAVKHLINDKKCGMCGAVTNSIGNQAMIGVNYKNREELDSFAYLYTSLHNNEIYTDVDRLAMFCTIIRKDIMDQYGLLDENYQVGMFEDDDYAKVVENAGYSFYIAEDVFVHHVNNASFKKLDSKEYQEIFDKNKEYFEKKWSTKWKMPKYRDGVTADINCAIMSKDVVLAKNH